MVTLTTRERETDPSGIVCCFIDGDGSDLALANVQLQYPLIRTPLPDCLIPLAFGMPLQFPDLPACVVHLADHGPADNG